MSTKEQHAGERFWSAKEWSMRTRIPYRAILAAAARGELIAVRPSGSPHGQLMISESSWDGWIEGTRVRARLPLSRQAGARSIRDLALH